MVESGGCVLRCKKNDDNSDHKIHASEEPLPFFHWPQKDNTCWVQTESTPKSLQPLTTGTKYLYICLYLEHT
jgi:hypothetical protein